jgi:S1-C subfamily serine protease
MLTSYYSCADSHHVKTHLFRAATLAACGLWVAQAFAQVTEAGSVTQELSREYAALVRLVAPAVVTVVVDADPARSRRAYSWAQREPVRVGGSGVVVGSGGFILTNYHVVDSATHIEVVLHDGRTVPATVLGIDPALDLAVLKAQLPDIPAARFGDSSRLQPGDWVLAIGAPFGLRNSVTAGVVSGVGRRELNQGVVTEYLQTDAIVNPGNSGGPLINSRGEVVGINTAYVGPAARITFAIPSNTARFVFDQIVKQGFVERGYIGLSTQDLDRPLAQYFGMPVGSGALVRRIDKGSPAERAGILPGDVIYRCGGELVHDHLLLLSRIGAARADELLTFDIRRRDKAYHVNVKVERAQRRAISTGSSAGATQDSMLGLRVHSLTPDLRQALGYRGSGSVVVTDVLRDSAAERAGVRRNCVVLEADFKAVEAPRDLVEAVVDKRMLLRIEDLEGEITYVVVEGRQ